MTDARTMYQRFFPGLPSPHLEDIIKSFSPPHYTHDFTYIRNFYTFLSKNNVSVLFIDSSDQNPIFTHIFHVRDMLKSGDVTVLHHKQSGLDTFELESNKCFIAGINNYVVSMNMTWKPKKNQYDLILTEKVDCNFDVLLKMLKAGGRLILAKKQFMKYDKDINNVITSTVVDVPDVEINRVRLDLTYGWGTIPKEMLVVLEKLLINEEEKERSKVNIFPQSLMDHMECPVCLTLLTPPTSSCSNGHSICCNCKQNVNSCPTCRCPEFVRNITLDHILKSMPRPCRGQDEGCQKLMEYDEIELHESICGYLKKLRCSFPYCSMSLPHFNYLDHFMIHDINEEDIPLCLQYEITKDIIDNLNETVFKKLKSNIYEVICKSYPDDLIVAVKQIIAYDVFKIKITITINGECTSVEELPLPYYLSDEQVKLCANVKIPKNICDKYWENSRRPIIIRCIIY